MKDVPSAVNDHAISIKGNIYSFDITYGPKDFIDVYIFRPACYIWDLVRTQPLPDGRPTRFLGFNVVAYGDCAYVCGGWAPGQSVSGGNLYRFDTNTMTWSCPEVCGDGPTYVCHVACVVLNCMYIIGSEQGGTLHFLDLDTYKWHRIHTTGDAPRCPPFKSACAIGSRIYVFGSAPYDNSVFYLDTVDSKWVRPHVEGVAPVIRISHAVFVYKGEMYIFGGYNRQQRILFADLHKYDPGRSCWTQVRPKRSGPCARVLQACCVIGDRVFLFRGRTSMRIRGGLSLPGDRQLVAPHLFAEAPLTDLHALDFAPKLQTLCLAALIDARVEIVNVPAIVMKEYNAMTERDINQPPS
ncbi:hypothetical protein V5799_016092 [Amblyomma americanum]|uniref:Kelch repeat protein n=1 Tax=Amblyomma americanum TaxID=6943 RepID=A0AAQ4F607_AMBAM